MPIDPSIVPRITAQSLAHSPFANLDNLMRSQIDQEELNKRRREAKRSKQMEEIWSTYGNDIPEALKRSYAVDPDKASEIQAQYSGAMANLALENARLMDIEKKEMDADYTALFGARGDPALLDQQLNAIAKRDPGFAPVAEAIRRNPATLDQLFESRGDIDNIFARRADANEKLLKGDTKRGAAGHLAAAWGTPEFEEILKEFGPHLGPGTTNLYRNMTREQLEQASMTANERADNAAQLRGQDIGAETTRRGQDVSAGTQIRGQDIGAATARRGQDIGAETARRGQNMTDARAAKTGADGAKLSATAIEKIAGADTALASLDQISRLYPDFTRVMGPVVGRAAQMRQTLPGASEGFAEFAAEVTTLKNAVIKATTGAQMSEPEARRIMSQVPDITNQPEVFKARMMTTKRNLETLKRRTIELSGGTMPESTAAPTTPAPARNPFRK